MKVIYLIGSLRNPEVQRVGNFLRSEGFKVFDDWYAGGPIADDSWQAYEESRGRHYGEALQGHAAQHVFKFDKWHLDNCSAAVLLLPAGKSGHMELGYVAGQNKPTFVLFDKVPERWDVMYAFHTPVFDLEALSAKLLDSGM